MTILREKICKDIKNQSTGCATFIDSDNKSWVKLDLLKVIGPETCCWQIDIARSTFTTRHTHLLSDCMYICEVRMHL